MSALRSATIKIQNEFQYYNDKGFFPELRPFGTAKNGQPHYELDLYIKGLDRSICLRRGAPSEGETRSIALQRLAELTDVVMYVPESFLTNKEFWEGYDYISYYKTEEKANIAFTAGMVLRNSIKKVTEKHHMV